MLPSLGKGTDVLQSIHSSPQSHDDLSNFILGLHYCFIGFTSLSLLLVRSMVLCLFRF